MAALIEIFDSWVKLIFLNRLDGLDLIKFLYVIVPHRDAYAVFENCVTK